MNRVTTPVLAAVLACSLWSAAAPDAGRDNPEPRTKAQDPPAKDAPREVRVLRERFPYSAVAYSPDGTLIAAACEDLSVKVWDVKTRKLRSTLRGHTKRIFFLAFSPDGALLASGCGVGAGDSARVWDVKTGKLTDVLKDESDVSRLEFGAGGKTLIGLYRTTRVRVWDADTGKVIHTFENCHNFALSPDRQTLASKASSIPGAVGKRTAINLWDLKTGKLTATLNAPHNGSSSYAFSPDGKLLAHGEAPGTAVHVWDLTRNAIKATIPVAKPDGIRALHIWEGSVAFSPDGKLLTVGVYTEELLPGTVAERVRLFEVEGGKEVAAVAEPGVVGRVDFHPDGRALAVAGRHGPVSLWDVVAGKMLPSLEEPDTHFVGALHCLAFSPDGKTLAARHSAPAPGTTGGRGNSVTLWEAASGKEVAVFRRSGMGAAAAFSPDGKALASVGTPGNAVVVWDVGAKKEKAVLGKKPAGGDRSLARSAVYSPDGKTIAAGVVQSRPIPAKSGTTSPLEILLWDPAAGVQRGRISAAALPRGVRAEVAHIPLAFSPDGKTLAFQATDGVVTLWDPGTGKEVATLEGHKGTVTALAFPRDGKVLASAGVDGAVRLWTLADRKQVASLEGHEGPVNAVAFSPDGRTLASAGDDKSVRLWHVATGKEVATIKGHAAAVHCLAYNPDGKTLASGGRDNTIRVWDIAFRVKGD